MEQAQILLDPTAELKPMQREPLPRPTSLVGLTVGLLDISKARGDVFLDRVEEWLQGQGVTTHRYKKPTFARIAPVPLQQQMATECDVVIEALAD